ncbi:MAG: hypothetical protein CMJ72_00285 [Planctomycetaceae bacterium]|jgi:uncharacterized coiled-coil DUF342 family protein|nr:hypothetical protein [Planctomycetaceae bacterium]
MEQILTTLEDLRKIVDKKATTNRENRDGLNEKMRGFIGTRNTYNSQVRELISEVQRHKVIRDEANAAVRTAKTERAEKNQLVRDAKQAIREMSPESQQEQGRGGRRDRRQKEDTPASLRRQIQTLENEFEMGKHVGSNEDKAMDRLKRMKRKLRDMAEKEDSNVELKGARETLQVAIDAQEAAHQEVTMAADSAQEAHDLMLKLSEEVDRLREQADASQAEVRRSKRDADQAHQSYIVSLRCLHSILDIVRAHNNRGRSTGVEQGTGAPARVEVQDLMSKLMSGETLSTEELMALQRGG